MDLVLCQFEPTVNSGVSIDSVLDELRQKGINVGNVNNRLKELGLEEGRSARRRMFVLHSMLRYKVDASFPRITPESFVGGVMPKGINTIAYTVDLSALEAEPFI